MPSLVMKAGRMPARAVRPLADHEVLRHFEVAAGKAELAEGLLEGGGDQMSLRGKERNVAGVVRQRHAAGVDVVVAQYRVELRHTLYPETEDIDVFQPQCPGQGKVGRQAGARAPAGRRRELRSSRNRRGCSSSR